MTKDVSLCPDCNTEGTYEGRVLIGGRGFYLCPKCGGRWQNAAEKPQTKGVAVIPNLPSINIYDMFPPERRRKLYEELAEMARQRRRAQDAIRDWPLP